MVGRADALRSLQCRLEGALHGQGALALISGVAGIGKTALALAFTAHAQQLGATTAIGRSYESGARPPYAAWQNLIANLEAAGVVEPVTLPDPFGAGPPARSAWQLMQAVVGALSAAAAVRPLVIALDDLQWADQETLDLLEVATRGVEKLPILVLATYRSDEVHRRHPLSDSLPILHRDRRVEAIALSPLSLADVALLVEARLGPSSPELASFLRARSEGNPFFAIELLRDLAEQGRLLKDADGRLVPPTGTVQVPEMLRQVVSRRVTRLGLEVETLLKVAAVIGEEWQLPILEAVIGWPEEPLLGALELALEAQVIAPAGEQAESYRFAHGLIREVLYDQQVSRRRRHVHARIAEAIATSQPANEQSRDRTAALAYHFAAAEDWSPAARYAIAAGDAARDRFASRSASQFYQQALDALARSPGPADLGLLLALSERLGQVHLVLGQQALAEAAFTRMLETARAAGDRLGEGHALYWLSFVQTRLDQVVEASSTGEAALRVAEEVDDRRLLALTHFNLGHVSKVVGEMELATHHLEQAGRLARQGGEPDVLSLCLLNLGQLAWMKGDYARGEALATEALAMARAGHDTTAIASAYWALGTVLVERGRYERARAVLQAGLEHTEESGDRHYLVRLLNTMGWLYSELGDAATAADWDRQALAACGHGLCDPVAEAERYSLLNLATDALLGGDLDAAADCLREFDCLGDQNQYARFRYRNRYHLVQGELALARGDADGALRRAEEATRLAEAKGMRKNLAKSWMLSGRALHARRRSKEASNLLRQAVSLADELEHGSLRWLSRLRLAQILAGRRPAEAARLYQEAHERISMIAADLADDLLRERFLGSPLVRDILAVTAAAADAAQTYPAGLTAREVEVLRLVAHGATSQAIAETLSISVKTVNAHLSSIFNKTDSANRAAATAFAFQHDLV